MKRKIFIALVILIMILLTILFVIVRKKSDNLSTTQVSLDQKKEIIDLKKLDPDIRLIWLSDENGKNLRPVLIRIGISDGQYTEIKEILYGEIKEGDFVVTGKTTPQSSSSQQDINRIFRSLR
ncbi:MAG: hypothetical protein ACP5IX_00420 [Patescibacteria group bacterium]